MKSPCNVKQPLLLILNSFPDRVTAYFGDLIVKLAVRQQEYVKGLMSLPKKKA